MKRRVLCLGIVLFLATFVMTSVQLVSTKPKLIWDPTLFPEGYEHGIALDLGDGKGAYWHFRGAGPSGDIGSLPGAIDIPGHIWKQVGPFHVIGYHYNKGGYFDQDQFWALGSDNPGYAELLFVVDGIIAPWNETIANKMAKKGYVHYHVLVESEPPHHEHPELVAWLKHTAVKDFYFNGGQGVHMHPDQINHTVYKNQADYLFLPNYFEPYSPLF